jgi:hypothetical protein
MLRIILIALAAACVTGCSTIQSYAYRDYAVRDLDDTSMKPFQTLVSALQTASPALGAALVDKKCFVSPVSAGDTGTCQASRDQAVSALIIASDGLCVEHRKTIYGNDVSYNVTLGTLTNLFAGGAAIVNSARRKAILGALALFTNSERSLISDAVYKNVLVFAVDKKILELRNAQLLAIKKKMGKPIGDYTMNSALLDVVEYHQSCSFMNGLVKALDEGTQGGNLQRISRLRNNLVQIEADLSRNPDSTMKAALDDRYKTISDELKTLESQ